MKIAIVCLNLKWQAGGPRLIFSSAQSLKKLGHQVVIYTPEFTGEYYKEVWSGLEIKVVKPERAFAWSGRPANIFLWIKKKWNEERLKIDTAKRIAAAMDGDFDLVNVHDFAYSTAYFYKKRNPRAKALWTENDPPYMYLPKKKFLPDLISRAYNALEDVTSRRYFHAIDNVAVLDFYNEAWCRKRGLRPTVIRLGVDPNFYLLVKDFYKKATQKKVTLFGLGALNEYRRYDDTIRAVKILRDDGYDARAKFICNDAWNEKEYRESLLYLVKENKLEDVITLHFRGVSEEELRKAYVESDIFVYAVYLPPPRNGFGFSIGVFEAMAAGLPVILCRTTTSAEALEDGKNAFFVDPKSPEQIAKKVKLCIDYPDIYGKVARAGQEVARGMTWEKYADEFLKMIIGPL